MRFVVLATVLSFAAAPADAARRGAVIAPGELSKDARGRLQRQIAAARVKDARTFEALAAMRASLPQLARRQRGRMVNLVRPLRALGKPGLMPMLAELAFDSRGRGALSERAWRGFRVSLLEAVGSLRDPRAVPVLEAVLKSDEKDISVLRTAARGLARLRTESAVKTLLQLVEGPDTRRRRAALVALGECRRPGAARALARILRKTNNETDRGLAIAALGAVGNLWAWRTLGGADSGEGDATRRLALEALIEAYPRLSAPERERAAKAILLVSHRTTRARIAAARARASGEQAAALDRLARRITRDGLLR
jgi:hypothetical protein